ncbi:Hypothetical predicted protein [Paramuricea clavata]|uniref:Uncharacterized protein n=1 Tax=Paramuricea clavata TaxID=317549 RepID=A0A6S7FQ75_PARCT|nr:Hypothetical predicted protein [Paramuricea clavata]
MVRDRVVIGCYSQKVREKLIQEGSGLTLEKAVDIAGTQEMSNTQLQSMAPEDNNVHSLRDERERKLPYKYDKRQKGPNTRDGMCKSKFKVKERKRQEHGVEEEESEESDSELYVGSVGITDVISKNEWYEDVKIAEKKQ